MKNNWFQKIINNFKLNFTHQTCQFKNQHSIKVKYNNTLKIIKNIILNNNF